MGMPWIKLYTEVLDDPKLGRLNPTDKWRFLELCLVAGECDAEGYLVNGQEPMSIEDIAWRLRLSAAPFEKSLQRLQELGLVTLDDGIWSVRNFSERQGRSQSEKREAWRERKRRQREGQDESRVTHAGSTALEQSRAEGEQEGEQEGEAEKGAADPHRRDSVLARLSALGVKGKTLDDLAGMQWVTVPYVDSWWVYIQTWPKASPDVKIKSLITRLQERRMPPPEFREAGI